MDASSFMQPGSVRLDLWETYVTSLHQIRPTPQRHQARARDSWGKAVVALNRPTA
jgi:hypothetical protein